MASPPFIITTTVPGDTDIVSQFPAVDRGHLDVVNSWLLTEHNTNGTHNQVTMPGVSAPTPPTGSTSLYRDSADGGMKFKDGTDSSVQFVIPPGIIVDYGGATAPTGWLICDGSAVSRTTFSRLFTAIGVVWGTGDGSTTFNLPDLGNRVTIGKSAVGRVTTAGGGVDGATLAAVGGLQNTTILVANLPPYTPSGTISVPTLTLHARNLLDGGSITAAVRTNQGTAGDFTDIGTVGAQTFTGVAQGGVSTPIFNIQPTAVVNKIIKY